MSKEYRRLETSADLNRLMTRYYTVTGLIGRLKPLAWVTSGAPIEILEAMGIPSVYPENYGALCGARRIATALCEVAEGKGYSQDLCSYARTSLGSLYAPDKAPMGGLPKPALLICCNNICGNVVKWYESVAAFYKVPMFMLDVPYVHDPEPTPHAVDYVAGQMQDLIDWLGYHTRRKMRPDRLQKVVDYSNEAVSLWREIRELCTARPSPLNAPDLFTSMAPVVVMRGTRQAVDYYRKLRREVLGRVKRGEGAIPQERHRLLWDNIAVWPRIFRLFGEFARYGGCFVVDTYTNAWSLSISAGDLMTGLARTYTTVYINQ
jgi:benzoyl-CoA reductase/2-hydroxyglutaryl-CoA dehydratase subunit BcrC/BadD/HgdB